MGQTKLTKSQRLSVGAVFIIVVSYALERVIELVVPASKPLGIILAMVYTVVFGVTAYIIYKSEDTTLGLLSAILGYKMMPVSISFLQEYSPEANLLYSMVKYFAIVVFVYLIYKLYKAQEKPEKIKIPVLFVLMFAVPFFTRVSATICPYFFNLTGSMLIPYFVNYACYAAATLVILGVAYVCGLDSLKYAAYFECFALFINIVRVAVKIGYRVINDWHISKNFYMWIAVYVILMAVAIAFVKIKEKKEGIKN